MRDSLTAKPAALCLLALLAVGARAATVDINIKSFRFGNNNAEVVVTAGDTVVWHNQDTSVTHTVTSGVRNTADAGKLFDMSVAPGTTVSYTFNDVGTFPYFCRPHSSMNSDIKVNAVTTQPVRGDVNDDGKVTMDDVVAGLRIVAGLDSLPDGGLVRVDVEPTSGDGVFDVLDVLRIERYVTQLDTTPM